MEWHHFVNLFIERPSYNPHTFCSAHQASYIVWTG